MKNFINFLTYLPKRSVIFVVALLSIFSITTGVLAGFGPDRPTKVYSPGVAGFDHVTFNSFTNVPKFGDERAFYNGQYQDEADSYYDPLTQVRDGDIINMHVYIHNGADSSLNASGVGIAEDVTVKVELPQGLSAKNHQSKATIFSDDAQPKTIFDTVDFSAENGGYFELDFVEGSAKLVGNGVNLALNDSLVSSGVNIGDVWGCYEYAVAVTFQVEIDMPNYETSKQVRKLGETSADWAETKAVSAGDKVEWLISFKNIGHTTLKNVGIIDTIPSDLTVVPGSVKLINSTYPAGYTFPDSAIQNGGKQINIGISSYLPGGGAYVMFTTQVDQLADLPCGPQTAINKAYSTPEGLGAISDVANITYAGRNCVTPQYSCSALEATMLEYNKFNFKATATTSGGAAVEKYVFKFGDGSQSIVTTNALTANKEHTYASAGNYDVEVVVHFDVDGQKHTKTCGTSITVEQPETPQYKCTGVAIAKLGGRKVEITVNTFASPANKVTVTGYSYAFGDGGVLDSAANKVQHTYASDGTKTINVVVHFNVLENGQIVKKDVSCGTSVNFVPVCVIGSKECPSELPNTGPAEFISALFGTSVLGASIRGWIRSKKDLLSIA